MPYTRITPSRNGREAIDYALGGVDAKGHNGNKERNLLVGSVNMLPPEVMGYADQMDIYWRKASFRNLTQVRRIITSYSKDEIDPNDPNAAEIVLAIHQEHARTAYPGRQVLICVQADGKGGYIHVHEIVNNVSMVDQKGCTTEQTKFHYVAKTVDNIAKKYIKLSMDYEGKYNEKTHTAKIPADNVTQNERRMRDANQIAAQDGKEPPHYIWKDDLKNRILAAMSEATSREDYLKRLTAHGVEGEYRTSKKHGDYIIYELTDTIGFDGGKIPGNLKSKSYKLGSDYGLDTLDKMIQAQAKETPPNPPAAQTKNELTPEELYDEASNYDEEPELQYDEEPEVQYDEKPEDQYDEEPESQYDKEKPPEELYATPKIRHQAKKPKIESTPTQENSSTKDTEQEKTDTEKMSTRSILMKKLMRDAADMEKKWAEKEKEEWDEYSK